MSFRNIIDARTSDAQYVGQSEMQSSEITKKQNNMLWHSSFDSVSMLKPQGELIHRHESGSGTEGQSMQDISGICSDRHSQRALNEGGRSTGRGYIQRTAGDKLDRGIWKLRVPYLHRIAEIDRQCFWCARLKTCYQWNLK